MTRQGAFVICHLVISRNIYIAIFHSIAFKKVLKHSNSVSLDIYSISIVTINSKCSVYLCNAQGAKGITADITIECIFDQQNMHVTPSKLN